MVIVKVTKNKWMLRYRTFFAIGIIILIFQIYLAVKYLPNYRTISENNEEQDFYIEQPQNNQKNDEDFDGGVNSAARKSKLDHFNLIIDDEDASNSLKQTKKTLLTNTSNNPIKLRLEELDFIPSCEITTKEAVSAIHRAKTQKCKQLIANITCLSYSKRLYPNELKNECPATGFAKGKQLGCFKDEKNFRLLNGYYGINKNDNSPNNCIKLCLQSGFQYAGVQYSNECFCGNDEPASTSKIPDSSCNMKCPGDVHATCGGYYTANIYQTGIKRFIPQIANTEYNSTINRSKIVFLLTLNGRAVRQVKRLIKNLYHKDHFYYIHVDVRQDYMFRELLQLERQLTNVRLTRKRFATIWGGASLLSMLLSCMQELLEMSDWRWDFVLNLSESDFPVKNISQLTNFISVNKDKNFVKSHGREVQRFIQKQGLDKTFVECETRMWRISDRQLPFGVQVDGGSDWIALSRQFVEYVAKRAPDPLVTGLLNIFKYTLLPAESFFHTVLRNSRYCNTYIDNNLHVTNWKRKLGCKCQYKHIVDWCGCSPNDFRPEDWNRIQNTVEKQLYFARKFEPIINQEIILQLEQWLNGKEVGKELKFVENLYGYWQNLYHFKDFAASNDDGLLTLGNSIIRRTKKLISNESCVVNIANILEVSTFHYKDQFKYALFQLNSTKYNLEVAIKPINQLVILNPSTLWKYVETFLISSEYDQKEQVSRNYLRILSPFTEPVLVYSIKQHNKMNSYNFTSLWINPNGYLVDSGTFLIDENSLIGHFKPTLKQPLMPGNWTVKLLSKNKLMAQLYFLIIPLEFYSGISLLNGQLNPFQNYEQHSKLMNNMYDKFLPNESERLRLESISLSNLKRFGSDLLDWIDALTSKFYSVEKVCVNNLVKVEICGRKIVQCSGTNWSSLAPDPKSAIGSVNSITGMFDIW